LAITKTRAAAIGIDRIGKVFKVVGPNLRECLVCEQLFSRQASAEHAKMACYPARSLRCDPFVTKKRRSVNRFAVTIEPRVMRQIEKRNYSSFADKPGVEQDD
jgi:hypothetical protein